MISTLDNIQLLGIDILKLEKEISAEEAELIECPKCGHKFDKDKTCQDH